MPSLFSRSRTTSTPQKNTQHYTVPFSSNPGDSPRSLDEFGRSHSRASTRGGGAFTINSPSKKDKKRAKEAAKRAKQEQLDTETDSPPLPDGSFLPLNLEAPQTAGDRSRDVTDYGYLSYERHVVLGLEQLQMLVNVVADELETRGGITTPFIFSTTALDISASAIKRLIRAFLAVCAAQGSLGGGDASRAWREEAKFAGPHELGMCLRWGLARVVRVAGGMDVRGLVSWDIYSRFRDSEAAGGYPPTHFETFLDELNSTLQAIVLRVLSLLTRLTANSSSSGHTPPTLSPLFGPLLFGLGPATLSFHHTYIHYLRAVHATEHILLAFIRWQDAPRFSPSSAATLGVPIRLKEWIKGYPAMLPFLHEQKNVKPQPRKGAKTVNLTSVRRNVRMYSPDLVKTAATWAHRAKSSNGVINGLANAKEWERIAPSTLKIPPRYSENYKKRMNMPPNAHPETAPGLAYSRSAPSSTTRPATTATSGPTLASTLTIGTVSSHSPDYLGGGREGEDRFRSLTDLKWGEFESMGFTSIGDDKKLQFDLTESAREERAAKRQTMSWTDFSAAGFTRGDAPLNTTLQFSTPVSLSVTNWPSKDAELTKKIKKTEKQLPPFGWDTEPVMGGEEIVEEAFVDVFCDLIYGGGWMDLERGEALDRDVNWALVEFKSLPPRTTATAPVTSSATSNNSPSDPRTSVTLILFEEFVPVEYRQQLLIKSTTRRRLPALFSPSKSKQWKQAPTLNGRPYVVGHVPRSPSYREMEFEGLLAGGSGTKVISLGSKASTRVVSTISSTTAHGGKGEEQPPPVPPLPNQMLTPQRPTTADGRRHQPPALIVPPVSAPSASSASTLHPRYATSPPSTPRPHKSDDGNISATTTAESAALSPSMMKIKSTSSGGSGTSGGGTSGGGSGGGSRFRITNVIPVPSPRRMSQLIMHPPSEYSAVDFSTRLAGYSDSEGRNSGDPEGDDELDLDGRHRSRRDDENAWVDILVNSHNRRMGGQDAEIGVGGRKLSGGGGGVGERNGNAITTPMTTTTTMATGLVVPVGVDPDMASLEVAQVLAAVRSHRNMSSSDLASISTRHERDEQEGQEAREHGPSVDMDAHVQGLEIDEIERVPRLGGPGVGGMGRGRGLSESESSTGHGHVGLAYDEDDEDDGEDGDDEDDEEDLSHSLHDSHGGIPRQQPGPPVLEQQEEVLPVRHALRQQRRMGYFDLHPERKQLYTSPSPERQSPPLLPDDTPTPTRQHQHQEHHYLHQEQQQQQQHPQYGSPSPSYDSSFRVGAEMVETAGVSLLPSLGSAKRENYPNSGPPAPAPTTATTAMPITIPPATPPAAHPIGPRAPASASAGAGAGVGTKTAALIEMYRERERRATSTSPSTAATATTTTVTTTSPSATITSSPSSPASLPSSIPVAVSSVSPVRLPSRSASLPGATNPNMPLATSTMSSSSSPSSLPIPQPVTVTTQRVPVVVEVTPPTPTPSSNLDVAEDVDLSMPRTTFEEETGRASPARYVHGAPLHNVLEEEEEED